MNYSSTPQQQSHTQNKVNSMNGIPLTPNTRQQQQNSHYKNGSNGSMSSHNQSMQHDQIDRNSYFINQDSVPLIDQVNQRKHNQSFTARHNRNPTTSISSSSQHQQQLNDANNTSLSYPDNKHDKLHKRSKSTISKQDNEPESHTNRNGQQSLLLQNVARGPTDLLKSNQDNYRQVLESMSKQSSQNQSQNRSMTNINESYQQNSYSNNPQQQQQRKSTLNSTYTEYNGHSNHEQRQLSSQKNPPKQSQASNNSSIQQNQQINRGDSHPYNSRVTNATFTNLENPQKIPRSTTQSSSSQANNATSRTHRETNDQRSIMNRQGGSKYKNQDEEEEEEEEAIIDLMNETSGIENHGIFPHASSVAATALYNSNTRGNQNEVDLEHAAGDELSQSYAEFDEFFSNNENYEKVTEQAQSHNRNRSNQSHKRQQKHQNQSDSQKDALNNSFGTEPDEPNNLAGTVETHYQQQQQQQQHSLKHSRTNTTSTVYSPHNTLFENEQQYIRNDGIYEEEKITKQRHLPHNFPTELDQELNDASTKVILSSAVLMKFITSGFWESNKIKNTLDKILDTLIEIRDKTGTSNNIHYERDHYADINNKFV